MSGVTRVAEGKASIKCIRGLRGSNWLLCYEVVIAPQLVIYCPLYVGSWKGLEIRSSPEKFISILLLNIQFMWKANLVTVCQSTRLRYSTQN